MEQGEIGGAYGARHKDKKKPYDGFVEKTEEREKLGDLELEGKTILEKYSILTIVGRIHLVQDTCR
jgi:hypothetical protein